MKIQFYILCFIVLFGQRNDQPVSRSVELIHLDSIVAGDVLQIKIKGDIPPASSLILDDGWTYMYIPVDAEGGRETSLTTTSAGINYLYLVSDDAILAESIVSVLPREEVGTIENFLGAKNVEVGSNDYAMIASLVMDEYGNMIPDSTVVQYDIFRQNQVNKYQTLTKNGISYKLIEPSNKKSRTLITGSSGNYSTELLTLNEKSNVPTNFRITAHDVFPYSSSRHYFQIKTSKIVDRWNNVVDDGTMVDFFVTEGDGESRRFQSYTTNGEATIMMENAEEPGVMTIEAHTQGSAQSNVLRVSFSSNIDEVPFTIQDSLIIVGPVFGHLGDLLPNGTPVKISASSSTQKGKLSEGVWREILTLQMQKAIQDTLIIEIGSEKFVKRIHGLED